MLFRDSNGERHLKNYCILGLLMPALACSTVAIAQVAPAPPQPEAVKEMREVTVTDTEVSDGYRAPNASTATKTDTPVMETPLNVQTVTQQVLVDQQAISLSQALQNVSGVSVMDGVANGGAFVSSGMLVRGFTETTYYRDGFRMDASSLGDAVSTRQLANVESVEVMKGPGAILYGLVEPGGIVNLVTKDPQGTPHYSVEQQVGSLREYRTSVDATGPLSEGNSLLYRLNASYDHNGAPFGSIVDLVSSNSTFVAPTLKWNVNNASWVKLEAEISKVHSGLYSPFDPLYNGSFMTLPRNANFGQSSPSSQGRNFVALTWSHQFNKDWSIKQQIAYDKVVEAYVLTQPISLQLPASPNQPLQVENFSTSSYGSQDTVSTNIDLTGHFRTFGIAHTLLAGGDIYRLSGTSTLSVPANPITTVGFPNPGHAFSYPPCPCSTTAYGWPQITSGLYVQDQMQLPESVFLLVGARYQHIGQSSTTGDSVADLQATGAPLSAHAITPRVGLLWRPVEWLSLYGNYTEGFGPNNGMIWPGTLVPPTSANSKEAGAKVEFFDHKLRMSADYFDLIKTNVGAPDPDPAHVCGGSQCSILIGKVRSKGTELDVQGEILPGWNVVLTYSNDDIRVAEGSPGSFDPVGQPLELVPRYQASFWNTFDFRGAALNGLKIGGGLHYTGTRPLQDVSGSPPGTFPPLSSYTTVDLMAAYSFNQARSKITAQLNITNVFDRTYYVSASTASPPGPGIAGSFTQRSYGAPLAAMGSMRVEF